MAVRLRLRRMGKKKKPFYRIVAIDSRAARGGKYLENIGYYNPLPDPVDLNVKTDRALYWLQSGAQPSDTVKSLLKRNGVMLRFDLLKKGKSEEEIEQEFQKWQELQEDRVRRAEAAKIQAESKKAKAEEKAAKKEEPVAEEAPAAEHKKETKAEAESPEKAEAAEEPVAEETESEEKKSEEASN